VIETVEIERINKMVSVGLAELLSVIDASINIFGLYIYLKKGHRNYFVICK
jgi:hypothetical protein